MPSRKQVPPKEECVEALKTFTVEVQQAASAVELGRKALAAAETKLEAANAKRQTARDNLDLAIEREIG